MTKIATPSPGRQLLSPGDHTLIMIDHQSQMAFAAKSIDMTLLRSNVSIVAEAARGFEIPAILTTVAAKSFSGPIFSELTDALPDVEVTDRTSMNSWEDEHVIERVNTIGLDRVVVAGMWTSVCIVGPVLSALDQGFEVFVITDACADVTDEAHERAVTRMVQAGAHPMTALQYLLELQRDWARSETYATTTSIAQSRGGAYGIGISYATAMFGGSEAHS